MMLYGFGMQNKLRENFRLLPLRQFGYDAVCIWKRASCAGFFNLFQKRVAYLAVGGRKDSVWPYIDELEYVRKELEDAALLESDPIFWGGLLLMKKNRIWSKNLFPTRLSLTAPHLRIQTANDPMIA